MAIRIIPSPEQNEQGTHYSHKRNYTTTICDASPARGSERSNQRGKRTRLVSGNLGDTTKERIDNFITPSPNTTICGEPPAMGIELCTQRGKSSRLLPKGLLVASNLGYTIRKRKDNPLSPPPNTKKR